MSIAVSHRFRRCLQALALCILIYVVMPILVVRASIWWFGSPLPWSGSSGAARARLAASLAWVALLSITALVLVEARRARSGQPGRLRRTPLHRLAAFIVTGLLVIPAGSNQVEATSSTSTALTVLRWRNPDAVASMLAEHQSGTPVQHLRLHRVEPGESLLSIASRYAMGRSVEELAIEIVQRNRNQPMVDGRIFEHAALIEPGWVLQIPSPPPSDSGPPGPVYTVRPGDSWGSIAGTFLGDPSRWSEIWLLNRGRDLGGGRRFDSPDDLAPGITVWLPAGTPSPAPPPPTPSPAPSPAPPPSSPAPVPSAPGMTLPELAGLLDLPGVGKPIGGATTKVPPPLPVDPNAGEGIGLAPDDVGVGSGPGVPAPEESRPPLPLPGNGSDAVDPSSVESGRSIPGALIGIAGSTMLLAGALAVFGLRYRRRREEPDTPPRLPDAMESAEHERRDQRVLSGEDRLIRLDLVLRAVGAVLADRDIAVVMVMVERSGRIALRLTAPTEPAEPWHADKDRSIWTLPGGITREELVSLGLGAPMPSIALVQLGAGASGAEVYIDLEVAGTTSVVSDRPERCDAIVRAAAASLALSPFADKARLVGCDVPLSTFMGHRLAVSVDEALDLPRMSEHLASPAFSRRSRSRGGERWQPTVVFVGSTAVERYGTETFAATAEHRLGHAALIGAEMQDASLRIIDQGERWTASGPVMGGAAFEFTPIGLGPEEIETVAALVDAGRTEPDEHSARVLASPSNVGNEPGASAPIVVCLFGPVEVRTATGERVRFGKKKACELLAWMVTHRHRSTRGAARTALWDTAVKDSTFANVVSDARRSLARAIHPVDGVDWIDRTLTEELRLHVAIESDADIMSRALERSRDLNPIEAVAVLEPVVSRLRGLPFEGDDCLWPDSEGITSSLVILGTTAARQLAEQYLSLGDLPGVMRATEHGLRVLPGHEELIELRLRAHGISGDIAGARGEWESHLRSISLDPWSDGRPAPRLQQVVDELIDTQQR